MQLIPLQAPRVRFDDFITAAKKKDILYTKLRQNQYSIKITFTDYSDAEVILPINYDITTFLIDQEIPIEVIEDPIINLNTFSYVVFGLVQLYILRTIFKMDNKSRGDNIDPIIELLYLLLTKDKIICNYYRKIRYIVKKKTSNSTHSSTSSNSTSSNSTSSNSTSSNKVQ